MVTLSSPLYSNRSWVGANQSVCTIKLINISREKYKLDKKMSV